MKRRTYTDYDKAKVALGEYLATWRGRLRRRWLARWGWILTVVTARSDCDCPRYEIAKRRPESLLRWPR
ncbi:hypothetical protein [Goodfellowiella coeruleoviolacea]|uniref:Uncharacterized protein n=1 Tax=Goodfellowiella coeruleoviolacea TaxID=334858 RepID=A0AAE3GH42_9PSEU|nr:hypothetical protein [Goodfellowiella coeruleoviolacea]MCP2168151.1 hypothetical protein [Goodfellowiella coeruleoviolacea]